MADEILFSGAYDGWEYSVKFDVTNATPADVSGALVQIHSNIESRAFCHYGVDCAMIEKEVPMGKGIPDAVRYLGSRKPGQWKEFMLRAAGREELIQAAESKFVCTLLMHFKIPAKIHPEIIRSSIKPQKQELLEGQIALIARYKDWISIKKMGLETTTKDYEVAGILSSINSTLVKKAFDFLSPDRGMEKIAAEATRGKRKSFINLAESLRKVEGYLTGNEINDAYLLKCVFENLGFAPYANVDVLVPAYPDLKTSKPRGRVAKG